MPRACLLKGEPGVWRGGAPVQRANCSGSTVALYLVLLPCCVRPSDCLCFCSTVSVFTSPILETPTTLRGSKSQTTTLHNCRLCHTWYTDVVAATACHETPAHDSHGTVNITECGCLSLRGLCTGNRRGRTRWRGQFVPLWIGPKKPTQVHKVLEARSRLCHCSSFQLSHEQGAIQVACYTEPKLLLE